MIYLKKILFIVFLFLSVELYAQVNKKEEINMLKKESFNLISEINRIGFSGKWNSSLYFEGPLKIHVLKNGTVTNRGNYTLSNKKFGYPASIRVYNIDNQDRKYIFIFSPPSQPIFKDGILVNINELKENGVFYKKTEILSEDDYLYTISFSPKKIYKHVFIGTSDKEINYDFYSAEENIGTDFRFIRLAVYF